MFDSSNPFRKGILSNAEEVRSSLVGFIQGFDENRYGHKPQNNSKNIAEEKLKRRKTV